jgi:hypothetical protein
MVAYSVVGWTLEKPIPTQYAATSQLTPYTRFGGFSPVRRIAAVMEDRDDEQRFRSGLKHDCIGKSAQQNTTALSLDDGVCRRPARCGFDSGLERKRELEAQTDSPGLVP